VGKVLSSTAAAWTGYAAIGSFFVYVLGYLALRFQLTALGVGTDLQLIDERYLFEGAKFLVYIVATIPVAVLIAMPLILVAWLTNRFVPAASRWIEFCQARPAWCLTAGVLLSLAVIQLVMRTCFLFDNLLLRGELPRPQWFAALLAASNDIYGQLYFAGLLILIAAAAALALLFPPREQSPLMQRGLWALLWLLVAVMLLLLPVNYGVLMVARPLPRLSTFGAAVPFPEGSTAWLVWEGQEGITFVVADRHRQRVLTTVPRESFQRVDIVGYDPLSQIRSYSPTTPVPRQSAWADLALLFGIGASPKLQKSPTGDPLRGDVYLIDAQGNAPPSRLTTGGRFHSPVFLPGDQKLLALDDERLVEINLAGGEPKTLATVGVTRLIGVHPHRPVALLALGGSNNGPQLLSFDLDTKRLTTVIDSPPADDGERAYAWYALGEARNYGDTRVFVQQINSEVSTWWDVLIQQGDQPSRNLTHNNGTSSRQPAMSFDGRWVAYVGEGAK